MQGARHSFQEGVGRSIANPAAILLAASKMLSHLNLHEYGTSLAQAVFDVFKLGKVQFA